MHPAPMQYLTLNSSVQVTSLSMLNQGQPLIGLSNGTLLTSSSLWRGGLSFPSSPSAVDQFWDLRGIEHLNIRGLPGYEHPNVQRERSLSLSSPLYPPLTAPDHGSASRKPKLLQAARISNALLFHYDSLQIYYLMLNVDKKGDWYGQLKDAPSSLNTASRLPIAVFKKETSNSHDVEDSQAIINDLQYSELNAFDSTSELNSRSANAPQDVIRFGSSSGNLSSQSKIAWLITADGFLYVIGSSALAGFANPNSNFPNVISPVTLPGFSNTELQNVDKIPIHFDHGHALVYTNGSLYAWGSELDLVLGSFGASSEIPVHIDVSDLFPSTASPINDPLNVTFICSSRYASLVILKDGTAFAMGQNAGRSYTKALQPHLTDFILALALSLNLERSPTEVISQVFYPEYTFPAFYILTIDGKLWLYTPFPGTYALDDLSETLAWIDPTQYGPWAADLRSALPSDYRIESIQTYAASTFAVARPRELFPSPIVNGAVLDDPAVYSGPPVPPDLRTDPPNGTHRVVFWTDQFEFGDSLSTFKVLEPYIPFPEPELNTFAQVAMGPSHYLMLTQNGSLLGGARRQTSFRLAPLPRSMPVGSVPILFDTRPLISRPIMIAVGEDVSAALLANGSLVYWGDQFSFPRHSAAPIPAPVASAPAYYQLPDTMANGWSHVQLFDGAPLIYVAATGRKIVSLDRNGVLFSIGDWHDSNFTAMRRHSELYNSYGSIRHFAFADGGGAVWMIMGNSSSALKLVTCVFDPLVSEFDDGRLYCRTAYDPAASDSLALDLNSVRKITAGAQWILLLTHSEIYGFGNHRYWFVGGDYATKPQIVSVVGLPVASSITNITVIQDTLLVVTSEGHLFSSCDGLPLVVCDDPTRLTRVLSQFKVASLVTHSEAVLFDSSSRASLLRAVILSSTPTLAEVRYSQTVAARSPSAPYQVQLFGSNSFFASLGWRPALSDDLRAPIYTAPSGHPLESANVFNLQLSNTYMFDYGGLYEGIWDGISDPTFTSGQPSSVVPVSRRMKVYGLPNSVPREHIPTLMSDFEGGNPQADRSSGRVHQQPLDSGIMSFFSNCSAYWSWDGDVSGLPTNFTVPFSWNFALHPKWTILATRNSSSQIMPFWKSSSPRSLFTWVPESTGCVNQTAGEFVTKRIWCEGTKDPVDSLSPMGDHFCIFISSTNQIYARGALLGADCSTGMFGAQESCVANTNKQFSAIPTTINRIQTEGTALANASSVSIGMRHVMALDSTGRVFVWGQNWRGQLGNPLRNKSETPVGVLDLPFGSFNTSEVIAAGRSSFVVSADRMLVASWGDHIYGQLGRPIANSYVNMDTAMDWFPGLVKLPTTHGPILHMKCTSYTCYVLYNDGELYSWGSGSLMSLGRRLEAGLEFDSIPALASLLIVNQRKITEIYTAKSRGSALIRSVLVTPPASPSSQNSPVAPTPTATPSLSPTSGCRGPPPSPAFTCINGVWTNNGDIVIGNPGGNGTSPSAPSSPSTSPDNPNVVVISGPTVIVGNGTVGSDGKLVLAPPIIFDINTPLLNVSGCLTFKDGGSFALEIPEGLWKQTKGKLQSQHLLLIESSCAIVNSSRVIPVKTPKDCRKTVARIDPVELPNGRHGLQTTFLVDSSKCSNWWIILVCVIAGVLIISGIIIIVYRVHLSRKSRVGSLSLKASVRA